MNAKSSSSTTTGSSKSSVRYKRKESLIKLRLAQYVRDAEEQRIRDKRIADKKAAEAKRLADEADEELRLKEKDRELDLAMKEAKAWDEMSWDTLDKWSSDEERKDEDVTLFSKKADKSGEAERAVPEPVVDYKVPVAPIMFKQNKSVLASNTLNDVTMPKFHSEKLECSPELVPSLLSNKPSPMKRSALYQGTPYQQYGTPQDWFYTNPPFAMNAKYELFASTAGVEAI